MAILINFFDNVILQAISEEIVPKVSFFKDRYFPTGAGDIFKANEVLTEYRSGDRKLAAFVDQKAGDIPIGRRSYEVHSYKPAYIAPSRLLTLDELTKRGFGEALYPGMDEAQRAARLLADDMNDMENRIARREEWMAAETMIGNGCVMQEYIDGATKGDSLVVKFYDGTSDHTYTASKKWNENGGDFWGDVKAMCRMLSARGLPAKDLILGTDVADYILTDERTRQLLDKNSGIIVGEIRQQLTQYDGVVFMGTLNFGGFMLNVFSVDETYEDETGKSARYFPATAAMVTAPDCGHMMYGDFEIELSALLAVSNKANISITVDPQMQALARMVKAEIEKHNANADAHAATITAAVSAAVKNLSESGEILNEEQVKALIKEQVDGGTGGGYYGSYELTLAADGWKPARSEDDYENAGGMDYYQCIYDAELSDSTSELVPVGVVSPGSFYTTTKAGVLNGCETHDGFIRFFAQRIPEADIQATVTLFGKGGGSGETGSVSIGQGLKRDASGAIAVRIGEGLDFDSANALTVRKETVMTSEDLLDEEETQQEIVDMLK